MDHSDYMCISTIHHCINDYKIPLRFIRTTVLSVITRES